MMDLIRRILTVLIKPTILHIFQLQCYVKPARAGLLVLFFPFISLMNNDGLDLPLLRFPFLALRLTDGMYLLYLLHNQFIQYTQR